jgi:hypothetical protein
MSSKSNAVKPNECQNVAKKSREPITLQKKMEVNFSVWASNMSK